MAPAETIAQAFHETYERLAPDHGYETRKASAKPWADVPEQNKGLMIAVVGSLLAQGVIEQPGEPDVELASDLAAVYRERAALVAHLAAVYPSAIVHGADPSAPDWPVIFIDTPRGQMSWHLAAEDLGMFGHVTEFASPLVEGAPTWDGHTTAEKYERLAALTADRAADTSDA